MFELRRQFSGECRLRFGLAAQDGDRVHEFAGHAIASDLGPGQGRRQAGLARAGRAGHDNHEVRPAFGDDSIELRRRLEIPGVFQDLRLSRTVLPEDLAGVAREVPREEEPVRPRVALNALRLDDCDLGASRERPARKAASTRSRGRQTPEAR